MAEEHSEPAVPERRMNLRPRKPVTISQEEAEKNKGNVDKEKPFVCEMCGAKFEFKRNLTRHQHYHKGKETLKCYFCGSKFTSLEQLHGHLPTCTLRLQPHTTKSSVQEDLSCTDTAADLEDMEDVDFVLNDDGDIEATQRTLEEMRQREVKFVENLWELLTLLLDGSNRSRILDAQKPVAQILEAVIVQCGHNPIRATGTYTSRLRENCKLLFKIAVGPSVEKLLLTKPIEVVLEEVIKRGKESLRLSQEVIIIDSDSEN